MASSLDDHFRPFPEGQSEMFSAYRQSKMQRQHSLEHALQRVDQVPRDVVGCINVKKLRDCVEGLRVSSLPGVASAWDALDYVHVEQMTDPQTGFTHMRLDRPLPATFRRPTIHCDTVYNDTIGKPHAVPDQDRALDLSMEGIMTDELVKLHPSRDDPNVVCGGLYRQIGEDDLNKIAQGTWTVTERNGVTALDERTVIAFSNSFLVSKSKLIDFFIKDSTTMITMCLLRIINDSRAANARQADSTHMPIASLPAFQQVISNIIRLATRKAISFYLINADVRHCFFQYPLPPPLAAMFTCRSHVPGRFFIPNALQMGFSLSPIIAQTGTWAMLLNSKLGPPPGVDAETIKGLERIPEWIELLEKQGNRRVPAGGIFVCIDNIFIITWSRRLITAWSDRINRSTAMINMKLKDGSGSEVIEVSRSRHCYADATARAGDAERRTYIGIEICYDGWCLGAPKPNQPSAPVGTAWAGSYREFAGVLGLTQWGIRVAGLPLLEVAEFMELYKRLTPPIKDYTSVQTAWDSDVSLSTEQFRVLRDCFDRFVTLRPHIQPWEEQPADTEVVWYICDAAGESERASSIAALRVDASGSMGVFQEEPVTGMGIADRELSGLHLCVRKAYEDRSQHGKIILNLSDNTVAISRVQRWWADDETTRATLTDMYLKLREMHSPHVVCYINSKSNLADLPSRQSACQPWRFPDDSHPAYKEACFRWERTMRHFHEMTHFARWKVHALPQRRQVNQRMARTQEVLANQDDE